MQGFSHFSRLWCSPYSPADFFCELSVRLAVTKVSPDCKVYDPMNRLWKRHENCRCEDAIVSAYLMSGQISCKEFLACLVFNLLESGLSPDKLQEPEAWQHTSPWAGQCILGSFGPFDRVSARHFWQPLLKFHTTRACTQVLGQANVLNVHYRRCITNGCVWHMGV